MSTSRNKVLLIIIGVLLVANIGMLVFLLAVKKPAQDKPKGPGFTERLKTEVGFTPAQIEVFEPLKKAHWAKMRLGMDSIKQAKLDFYNQLYTPGVPDSLVRARAACIGEKQSALDYQLFSYFREVRSMCTPQQLPKYDSVLPAVIQWITDRPR